VKNKDLDASFFQEDETPLLFGAQLGVSALDLYGSGAARG